jgi:hypothetical protein
VYSILICQVGKHRVPKKVYVLVSGFCVEKKKGRVSGQRVSIWPACAKPGRKFVGAARGKAPRPRFRDLPMHAHRSGLFNDFCTAPARWRGKNAGDLLLSQSTSRS